MSNKKYPVAGKAVINTLSEPETESKLVEPMLDESGWTRELRVRQFPIKSKERFYVNGEDYKMIPTGKYFADYVLKYNGIILAVVEVKREGRKASDGQSQAMNYSKRLDVPIAYYTNGHDIWVYDRRTLKHDEVDSFLSPEELLQIYKEYKGLKSDNLTPLEYPNYITGGKKTRSYQETAIRNVITSVLKGEKKALITMATGTGKTFTAFQICWKLIKSEHFSRVLFLTDRTFLRDQGYDDDFAAFGKSREYIMGGKYEHSRNVYFSTYQTLYADTKGKNKKFFQTIDKDMFDMVIIDECHRSSYGTWGEILKHFSKAVHFGMTATPERKGDNEEVYSYFGKPVHEYSLGDAINDGYLVPYKIYRYLSNLDKDGGLVLKPTYEVKFDDEIVIKELKSYIPNTQFEKQVTLPDRIDFMCKEFLKLLKKTNKQSKTIIFCADQEHAKDVAARLNDLEQNENFATSIISEDKSDLTAFTDPERQYPQIATTFDLLSTGVNIPHLQNIVFMRRIGSTVTFKQIIGRGSRTSPGKGFFRILDFTYATRLFDEWDVPNKPPKPKELEEPKEPYNKRLKGYVFNADTQEPLEDVKLKIKVGRFESDEIFSQKDGSFKFEKLPSNETLPLKVSLSKFHKLNKRIPNNNETQAIELRPIKVKPKKTKVKGVEVIMSERLEVEFDGQKYSNIEYENYVKDEIKDLVKNSKELKKIWLDDKKREEFIEKLYEKNVEFDAIRVLKEMDKADSYDIIAHIVFDLPLLTTDDRIKKFFNTYTMNVDKYNEEVRDIIDMILEKYRKDGINSLRAGVLDTPDLRKINAKQILLETLGVDGIKNLFGTLKRIVYE